MQTNMFQMAMQRERVQSLWNLSRRQNLRETQRYAVEPTAAVGVDTAASTARGFPSHARSGYAARARKEAG